MNIIALSLSNFGTNASLHQSYIQGQSRQTVFFELALRDRNVQVRFCLKVVLKSRDVGNFATATCFHNMHTMRPLLDYFPRKYTFYGKMGMVPLC